MISFSADRRENDISADMRTARGMARVRKTGLMYNINSRIMLTGARCVSSRLDRKLTFSRVRTDKSTKEARKKIFSCSLIMYRSRIFMV